MGIFSNSKHIMFYILITIIFYLAGKLLSKCDRTFMKKIIKSKRHKMATDRMMNNYWGNMISVLGAVISVFFIFGPARIEFYVMTAFALIFAYVFHLSDVLGISLDAAITYFMDGNDKSVKQYFQGTVCSIFALLIAGAAGVFLIAPITFKEHVKTEESTTVETMKETNNEKEKQFMDAVEDAFK